MQVNTREFILCEIRKEKDRHIDNLTKIINDNLGLNKESLYYYRCQGSGYYLKFSKVSGETIIFNIYSKGGVKKDKNFYINWYGINSIKEIK